jgi:transaldolase
MQLFLDTADIPTLRQWADTGMVDGVTTNPSLIAAAGRDFKETIGEICGFIPGPVSAEVAAVDAPAMIAEGERLAAIAPNVVVKLPITWEGLKACRHFSDNDIKTNLTLCFSPAQAMLAAKAGATFVSPFLGRIDDHGGDGMEMLAEIRGLYDAQDYDTEILAASVRTASQVAQAALTGADAATLPPAIFAALVKHPLTDAGLDKFLSDWKKTGQSIL